MSYDLWKTTDPAAEMLGPEPREQGPRDLPEIITSFWIKPIPTNKLDWSAVLESYEGGDPIGHGATKQEAIADLLEQIGVES